MKCMARDRAGVQDRPLPLVKFSRFLKDISKDAKHLEYNETNVGFEFFKDFT